MRGASARERRTGALHLFALAGIAAQPLYDLLARSPEFFLVRRAGPADALLAPLLFSIALPAGLALWVAGAARLRPGLGRFLQTVLVGFLVAAIVLPAFVRFVRPAGAVPLAGALLVGGAFALAYGAFTPVRMFASALVPAAVLLPVLFVARTWSIVAPGAPARRAVTPSAPPAVEASVVVVVFDEFSLGALLDAAGGLDGRRYPGFARLARDGTWFRNATTVATVTQAAVPALLTGRLPPPNALADPGVHARNLFTLLASSHRLDVTESYVPFCPAHLCGERRPRRGGRPGLAADLGVLALRAVLPIDLWAALPDIDYASMLLQPVPQAAEVGTLVRLLQAQRAHDEEELGGRARVLADFVSRLGHGDAPALHYLHVMLPHEPSVHMPSGALCVNDRSREPGRWPDVAWQVARAYQRHLLQVEFVDGMMGRLVEQLERTGAWDSTLLVVTADHGVAFGPGGSRRALGATNACELLRVPLFVKAPGQRAGGVSDRNVESIDVLPTIAALLGVEVPWPTDGASAVEPAPRPRRGKIVVGPSWPEEAALFAEGRTRTLPAAFGVECGAPGGDRAWFGVDEQGIVQPFALGPHRELLGRRVDALAARGPGPFRVALDHAARYEAVDPASGRLPCPITGRIRGGGDPGAVAIAVDGTIRAVTETAPAAGGEAAFSVVVPEAAFRAGRNAITVHRVVEADPPRLELVPPAS